MVKHEVDSVPEEEAPEAGGAQLRLGMYQCMELCLDTHIE